MQHDPAVHTAERDVVNALPFEAQLTSDGASKAIARCPFGEHHPERSHFIHRRSDGNGAGTPLSGVEQNPGAGGIG